MFKIGPHLSTSRGYTNMGKDALKISATTFQFFSRNPRGSKMKKLDEEDIRDLMDLARENIFGPLLAHAPYTLKPCSSTENVREFANLVLAEGLAILKTPTTTFIQVLTQVLVLMRQCK